MADHTQRKADHLDLAATDAVAFKGKTTLLEQVQLVHDALPDLDVRSVDLSVRLCGQRLSAPIVIAAMTGGLERAARINQDLATVAQERGIAFGFGSMRPLLENGVTEGYLVRDVAPDAVLFGNIGVVQAREASAQQLADMIGAADCDALCVHLNPAQEVIQAGGDEDFTRGIDTIARLVQALPVPIIVKETGCGLSRAVGRRLVQAGVVHVDTGGAGGTSWVGVETLRARAATRTLGETYWDWGIPTAASVAQLSGLGLRIIATGGVNNGLDIARAIALGATAGGMARPFLQAWSRGGIDAVREQVDQIVHELRVAHLLTGSRTPEDLQRQPVVLGQELAPWVPRETDLAERAAP